jgi:hypothetical protein
VEPSVRRYVLSVVVDNRQPRVAAEAHGVSVGRAVEELRKGLSLYA